MHYLNIPIPGISRPPACDKEATQDFIDKRAQLTPEQVAAVERVVESFNTRPSTTGDIELPGTVIGTAHARIRNGVYVLYQQFSQHGQTKLLIKLWYCGTYDGQPGSGRFDFQTEMDEAAGE
ncbi:hypothetical protein [Azospirillum thermophilum]|uniref:Type II toxin-antitoxin system RelE/ParE family toxin n=1 Tax=Azospirillum thermophilum TaxID=2202148 RepID=A0A2S2CRA3_9PROT|nr:hypothetical protein [Azospirillum thermophilum]AWK86827.1 hypothetical protein DEW08_11805 [Azospirillum thermophilum]